MRSATLVFLTPLILVKGIALYVMVEDAAERWTEVDRFPGVFWLCALLALLTADLFIFWHLSAGWTRVKKWVWPRSIFVSVPANLLVGSCMYAAFVPKAFRAHPAIDFSFICPVGYVILVLFTFSLADRDRFSRRGLKAASQENQPPYSR